MKKFESMTDEELALQYAGGNNGAFDELLARNQSKLFTYIMFVVRDQELANDIFQDTFVKVITKLKEGKYIDSGKFSYWITRIAHNVIMDGNRQREVVYMRFYQNLSFKEIADITGVSINTSLGRMRYAILNLRRMAKSHDILLKTI